MVRLLAKLFIGAPPENASGAVRLKYGVLCGACGIFFNLLLAAAKLFAGLVSGSVAMVADALNNASDMLSSLVTAVGFRLSERKPDNGHPYGHGRIEYIAGLLVAVLILFMGAELLKSSVKSIFSPGETLASPLAAAILAGSVLVKLYMFAYNRAYGKKLGSETMLTAARDSLCDVAATSAVLCSLAVKHFTGTDIDGYTGAAVSVFIIVSGIFAVRDTVSPLLGSAPDGKTAEGIRETVLSHPEIIGIHDLMLHDYGPGKRFVSLHAQLPAGADMLSAHDVIDKIEREIYEKFGAEATIHADPTDTRDPLANRVSERACELLSRFGAGFSAHDIHVFRCEAEQTAIFDISVPAGSGIDPEPLRKSLVLALSAEFPDMHFVIRCDRDYSEQSD